MLDFPLRCILQYVVTVSDVQMGIFIKLVELCWNYHIPRTSTTFSTYLQFVVWFQEAWNVLLCLF